MAPHLNSQELDIITQMAGKQAETDVILSMWKERKMSLQTGALRVLKFDPWSLCVHLWKLSPEVWSLSSEVWLLKSDPWPERGRGKMKGGRWKKEGGRWKGKAGRGGGQMKGSMRKEGCIDGCLQSSALLKENNY
jgi:hypothetical protein